MKLLLVHCMQMMKNRKPRKDGRYSINVSFTKEETDLIAHADKQGNFSNYVKKLIREDIEKVKSSGNQGTKDLTVESMLKLLSQQLVQNNQQPATEPKEQPRVEEPVKKANKGAIMNIMATKKKK